MNDEVAKKLNIYKRRLEEEKILISVYTIIFIFTVVIYGFFGIPSFFKAIKSKVESVDQLGALVNLLSQKKEKLIFLEGEIIKVNPHLEKMYSVITDSPKIEEYLLSSVEAASKSGFKQKKLDVESVADDSITILSAYEGNLNQLTELIKNIESINRLTKIEEFDFSYREGVTTVKMRMIIYFAKKDI
ncbi:hypothetical protein A2V49_02550 [candidate division WWE3 bacterium RBG_19FT_COMBO_34_6]|uniref:Uncharacterized protein n=1 Tax=candidate division WWE3 bacterium RBG_19FT_COMBO_34_6 TaxID=1802612 RepID=A0A1F4ULU7_UNCKA|nr:MAG: hypothetical protein A2V49_02550 [candidate division WWE3 bacterium RBG_19FT_COMBO_34_6]